MKIEVELVKIAVEKLLSKMEEEVKQAKNAGNNESLREKIYSIKILCDLILDENQAAPQKTAVYRQPAAIVPQSAPVIQQPAAAFPQHHGGQQPVAAQPSKKLEMDDGANGDSLFDF